MPILKCLMFNIGLITLLHTIVYPCFFPSFLDFSNIHECANEIRTSSDKAYIFPR